MSWESFLTSLGAMLAYMAISYRANNVFVFSRYSMYANLGGREEGAIFYVRVAGREVDLATLTDFYGIAPERIHSDGHPCSQQWVVVEARRWVADHASAAPPGNAVEVELGFRYVRVHNFTLSERLVPLAAGLARARR